MTHSLAQWLIGLGATLLLALIGGIVKVALSFADLRARVKQLEDSGAGGDHETRITKLEQSLDLDARIVRLEVEQEHSERTSLNGTKP